MTARAETYDKLFSLDHLIVENSDFTDFNLRAYECDAQVVTSLRGHWSPIKRLLLPFAVAASFTGSARPQEIRRAFESSAATQLVDTSWRMDEVWEASPQLITNEQVKALNELLATPYVTSPGIGDLFDE
jgi:hypothetical protein